MGVIIVIVISVAVIAAIVIKTIKDKREEQEAAYYRAINEKEQLGEINTPSGKNVFESAYTQYDVYRKTSRPFEIIKGIAIATLVLSIITGIVAVIGYASIDKDYIATGVAICVGCMIEGLVMFGILYGIAHIVKNTDETRQETMDIGRRLDKMEEE